MPNYFSQDFVCASCSTRFNQLVDRADRGCPVPCEVEGCDGMAGPAVGAPMIFRASYPDGTRNDDGLKKLKEAAALEVKLGSTPPDKRADIQAEIAKLKSLNPN